MFVTLSVAFLTSSVPGALLGLVILKGLEKRLKDTAKAAE